MYPLCGTVSEFRPSCNWNSNWDPGLSKVMKGVGFSVKLLWGQLSQRAGRGLLRRPSGDRQLVERQELSSSQALALSLSGLLKRLFCYCSPLKTKKYLCLCIYIYIHIYICWERDRKIFSPILAFRSGTTLVFTGDLSGHLVIFINPELGYMCVWAEIYRQLSSSQHVICSFDDNGFHSVPCGDRFYQSNCNRYCFFHQTWYSLSLFLSLSLSLSVSLTFIHLADAFIQTATLSKRFQTHNIASRDSKKHCSQKQAQPHDLARTHTHTHTRSHAHTHINSHSLITLDEALRITQLHRPSPITTAVTSHIRVSDFHNKDKKQASPGIPVPNYSARSFPL